MQQNIVNCANFIKLDKNINFDKSDNNDNNDNNDNSDNSDSKTTLNCAKNAKFNKREIYIYNSLNKYFSSSSRNNIKKKMVDIINGNSFISLRLLDWFVTQYCKEKNVSYSIKTKDVGDDFIVFDDNFNVYISYKAQLKIFSKKGFDPFRRSKKFNYILNIDNTQVCLETTIGQLQFFKWIFENKIFDYISTNYDTISNSMILHNKLDKDRIKNKDKKKSDQKSSDSDSFFLDDTEVSFE